MQSQVEPLKIVKENISIKGRVSIIIPCYNEERKITSTVEKVERYLTDLKLISSWEIIIVNDGSTDTTPDILKDIVANSIKVISFLSNQGRGAAIKAGVQAATGEFIITIDADLSYDLDHIGQILEEFRKEPNTDVVIVSAYMKGGRVFGVPLKRLLLSRIANGILSRFFRQKLSTVTCVLRGYKSEIIKNLFLIEKGKEFHLEVLSKLFLNEAKIKEIPGRLVWKREKTETKTSRNLNLIKSSRSHLLYALAIKPHSIFKYATIGLLVFGLYETFVFSSQVIQVLELNNQMSASLWLAMKKTFNHSPHTFFLGLGSLILSLNMFFFSLIIYILRINHENMLRHLLAIYEKNQPPTVD